MIPCQHKMVMFATNLGAMVESCNKLGLFVDDGICSKCEMQEGETPYVPSITIPDRRPDEQIEKIKTICEGCPLYKKDLGQCSRIMSPVPISILAQNKVLKCPEKKW